MGLGGHGLASPSKLCGGNWSPGKFLAAWVRHLHSCLPPDRGSGLHATKHGFVQLAKKGNDHEIHSLSTRGGTDGQRPGFSNSADFRARPRSRPGSSAWRRRTGWRRTGWRRTEWPAPGGRSASSSPFSPGANTTAAACNAAGAASRPTSSSCSATTAALGAPVFATSRSVATPSYSVASAGGAESGGSIRAQCHPAPA